MNRKSLRRLPLPSSFSFWGLAAALTLLGLALIGTGFAFASDSIWRVLFHAVGGAVIGLGWVELLHEWAVAKKVREEFLVLGDFIEKGIERICTGDEITEVCREELASSRSLKVIGIAISWLVKGRNRDRLIEMLESKLPVEILVPDPCAREIIERYNMDEPPTFEYGLTGLAERLRDWHNLCKKYSTLTVRAYHRYPVANITILDNHVYVGPVLYKRRAKDNLTAIFRKPSKGAEVYEDHFKNVFEFGSVEVTEAFMAILNQQYPDGIGVNVSSASLG